MGESAVDEDGEIGHHGAKGLQSDACSDPGGEIGVVFSGEVVFVDEEHHYKGANDQNKLDAFEYFLPQEGDLGILFEFGTGVEKRAQLIEYLADAEMRAHDTFCLDVCPVTLVEDLLEVDALLVGAGDQHLDHDDEVEQHGRDFEREEEYQINALLLDRQKYQQIHEAHSHQGVHHHVEPVQAALHSLRQVEYFIIEALLLPLRQRIVPVAQAQALRKPHISSCPGLHQRPRFLAALPFEFCAGHRCMHCLFIDGRVFLLVLLRFLNDEALDASSGLGGPPEKQGFAQVAAHHQNIINLSIYLLNFTPAQQAPSPERHRVACMDCYLWLLLLILVMMQSSTKILITVGTTEFDALIQYADSEQFIGLVKAGGYQEEDVLYQFGTTGKYVPAHANQFRLHPDIQKIYDAHEVVITHGGAGTLLACLYDTNPRKKVIAVANTTLAGNHQTELISKLHKEQYILGFNSVEELRAGGEQLVRLLKGQLRLRKYVRTERCVLNTLVFGDEL